MKRFSLGELARLWRAAKAVHPGSGPKKTIRHLRFLASAGRARSMVAPMLAAPSGSSAGQTFAARPILLATFMAPYLNAAWSGEEAVHRLLDHLAVLDAIPALRFPVTHRLELVDLAGIGPGYAAVLDKPEWFQREGVLVLNLFHHNTRLFSLAFALEHRPDGLTALIGGVQGRKLPAIADTYKAMTKAAHGMRPRDLLLELFKAFCRDLGVIEILAVADACRHHRHTFFGQDPKRELPLDYDEIWIDRGATPVDDCFFRLPLDKQSRDAADIPARKRAMYRQRYELLDAIERDMAGALGRAQPVDRGEAE